jgi:hypothetical protein
MRLVSGEPGAARLLDGRGARRSIVSVRRLLDDEGRHD